MVTDLFFAKIGHFDEVCADSDGTETCADGDQLKSLLGQPPAPQALGGAAAPSGSSASGEADADTATSTTPAIEEKANAPGGPSEASAVSAQEGDVSDDDGAEATVDTSVSHDLPQRPRQYPHHPQNLPTTAFWPIPFQQLAASREPRLDPAALHPRCTRHP
jgi:hypothetical protein